MHLNELHLERFRSFSDGRVAFHPHLTALVGENNGGKSNVIDAVRLITQPMNGRRELYCEESDIRRGAANQSFRIEASFDDLDAAQKGLLVSAVPDPTKDQAIFGLSYGHETGRDRPRYWAGKFEADPEPGSTDLIRHVYLPPLRDAQRALASGNPTRIAALIRHFLDGSNESEQQFKDDLKRKDKTTALDNINSAVMNLLQELTGGARHQTAALGFSASEEIYDIARDLRFKLADAGVDPEELRHSGLGYANLLFMTTVMVELQKAQQADLTLFLVEEPEAHLHPQLQMLVLDFLQEKAKQSAEMKVVSGQPAGRIQVIVTTHSPNLTAWIKPEHLVVMRTVKMDTEPRPVSLAISVQQLGLKRRDLGKISRYLDVTRSALIFGGRVLLLEGIAEALLVPAMAKRLFEARMSPEPDRNNWKRFQGTTLVAIDGVDFQPYLDLLLTPVGGTRIADKVVVITDEDPGVGENRPAALRRKAEQLQARNCLDVHVSEVTLEQALFLVENEMILKSAYLDLHPRSEEKWNLRVEDKVSADRPAAFLSLFTEKNSSLRKGDYAQTLANRLDNYSEDDIPRFLVASLGSDQEAKIAYNAARNNFKIPQYIADAIKSIVA